MIDTIMLILCALGMGAFTILMGALYIRRGLKRWRNRRRR